MIIKFIRVTSKKTRGAVKRGLPGRPTRLFIANAAYRVIRVIRTEPRASPKVYACVRERERERGLPLVHKGEGRSVDVGLHGHPDPRLYSHQGYHKNEYEYQDYQGYQGY